MACLRHPKPLMFMRICPRCGCWQMRVVPASPFFQLTGIFSHRATVPPASPCTWALTHCPAQHTVLIDKTPGGWGSIGPWPLSSFLLGGCSLPVLHQAPRVQARRGPCVLYLRQAPRPPRYLGERSAHVPGYLDSVRVLGQDAQTGDGQRTLRVRSLLAPALLCVSPELCASIPPFEHLPQSQETCQSSSSSITSTVPPLRPTREDKRSSHHSNRQPHDCIPASPTTPTCRFSQPGSCWLRPPWALSPPRTSRSTSPCPSSVIARPSPATRCRCITEAPLPPTASSSMPVCHAPTPRPVVQAASGDGTPGSTARAPSLPLATAFTLDIVADRCSS